MNIPHAVELDHHDQEPMHVAGGVAGAPDQVSFTMPRPFSANAMWQRKMTRKGRRDLTPDYKRWRDDVGWEVKRQTAGMRTIDCRFDLRLHLPPTRMDHDNAVKPTLDLVQHIGLITNDRNLHGVEVIPSDRSDCLVVLILRPDLPARPVVKRRKTWERVVTKRKPSPDDVARARRAGVLA